MYQDTNHRMVGHNIFGFDLPYLVTSTTKYEVKGNPYFLPRGNYWHQLFYDTMKKSYMPTIYGSMIGLDALSKTFGFEGKSGNGKNFFMLPRAEQESYLENDLRQSQNIFRKDNNSWGICEEDQYTVFDIETAPLPDEEIIRVAPTFNPDKVKLGNLKDPDKIEQKIESARDNHYISIIEGAGLDPRYSKPYAIGYIHDGESMEMDFSEPTELLRRFWEICTNNLTK